MTRHAWIAVGLAILVIGCGGAGGGSNLSPGATGGSTGLTTSSGGSTGSTGSTGTTGSTTSTGSTGSTTSTGTTGSTDTTGTTGSSTGSTDGSTTIVATDDSGSGTTTGSTTGSTDGSTTGTSTGTTGGTTTGSSTGGSTGSSAWADQFSSITVKLYEVDLLSNSGNVVAFSDPAGTDIDVKQLSDNSGAKFQFLNNTIIPFGTYTGVKLVLSSNFTAVLTSNGQTLNEQFAPVYADPFGHTVLTYTFASPVTVGSGGATFAIDFALGDWYEQDGYVYPTVGEGSTVGIDDPTKQITSRTNGFVKNLVAGQSFDLKHGNHDIHVTLGPGTVVTGGTLKNNQHVFVYAAWSQSSKTLIATKVQIK